MAAACTQELVERDCITREQLSNIFAAREEIHHAVGKLQNLFSTGNIDKVRLLV